MLYLWILYVFINIYYPFLCPERKNRCEKQNKLTEHILAQRILAQRILSTLVRYTQNAPINKEGETNFPHCTCFHTTNNYYVIRVIDLVIVIKEKEQRINPSRCKKVPQKLPKQIPSEEKQYTENACFTNGR